MKNISKAILAVMQEVKGIEKSMTVGSGSNAYQGVPDKEVKKIIGESMAKNGLCILPTSIEPRFEVSRYEETNQYGTKQKQSVFTEVKTKYLLLHESGESIELSGYGHGVDSQDKGAGKATTYALKYTLLYAFLVPTGKIDDADNIHSDEISKNQQPVTEIPKLPTLTQAIYETTLAKDVNGLTNVWNKYKEYQNDEKFKIAVKNRKEALNNA
jgi:hypothetical protein